MMKYLGVFKYYFRGIYFKVVMSVVPSRATSKESRKQRTDRLLPFPFCKVVYEVDKNEI